MDFDVKAMIRQRDFERQLPLFEVQVRRQWRTGFESAMCGVETYNVRACSEEQAEAIWRRGMLQGAPCPETPLDRSGGTVVGVKKIG